MTRVDAGENPVRPSTFPGSQPDPIPGQEPLGGPGVFGGGQLIDLIALGKAQVPVARNRGLRCGWREDDTLPVPATTTFQIRELKQGRWHRTHGHHPERDGHYTVCGRFIPGQRLMLAQYFMPPHRGPSPEEVERDRLCCRCF